MNAILAEKGRGLRAHATLSHSLAHFFAFNNCKFRPSSSVCAHHGNDIVNQSHHICAICLYANQNVRASERATLLQQSHHKWERVDLVRPSIRSGKICVPPSHHRCAPNESPIYICQSISSTHFWYEDTCTFANGRMPYSNGSSTIMTTAGRTIKIDSDKSTSYYAIRLFAKVTNCECALRCVIVRAWCVRRPPQQREGHCHRINNEAKICKLTVCRRFIAILFFFFSLFLLFTHILSLAAALLAHHSPILNFHILNLWFLKRRVHGRHRVPSERKRRRRGYAESTVGASRRFSFLSTKQLTIRICKFLDLSTANADCNDLCLVNVCVCAASLLSHARNGQKIPRLTNAIVPWLTSGLCVCGENNETAKRWKFIVKTENLFAKNYERCIY